MPDEVCGVRVAGLPVEALDGLRFRRTWTLVDELAHTGGWLAGEGETISKALHRVIEEGERPELRAPLVALRRAVSAGRRPDTLERVRDALPDELAGRIATWRARLERQERVAELLPRVLADELAERTGTLREVVADEAFRRGLAFSSPYLSGELARWLDDPAAVPGRPELLRLARYVARVSAKTSPYATFTVSGLGRWGSGEPGELSWRAVGEFDLGTVRRIWERLAHRPELRHAVEVRVNPSLVHDEDRLWFLGPPPGEQLLSVPAEPAVLDLLDRVRGASRPTLGMAPGPLDQLLEIGLVERRRPFDDQAADPLGALLAWLEGALPELPELSGLRELHEKVAAGAVPDPRLIRELTGSMPVKNVYLDTAVCPEDLAVRDPQAWLPDLDAVRRLLGLLDPDLPAKIAAAELFLRLHDPHDEVPFLRFYRQAQAIRPEPPDTLPDLPRVRELTGLRRHLWQTLYGMPEDARGVIIVESELVDKMAASWPEYVRPPGSIACYGQPAGPDFVLNAVYSGYGRHVARVRHLLGAEAPPGGPSPIIECLGSFGRNLNLRPASARGLDYPFTVTENPQLSLADLRVTHSGGRLVLRDAHGAEARPVHLGMTSRLMLPPAWSFLISVFGEPPVALPPLWRLDAAPGQDRVRRRPRLQLGRIVVTRARWTMRAAELPIPDKGEPDAAYLVRLASWLRRHGIPKRFFARVLPSRRDAARKNRKPLYIDVTDHFLLLSLTRSTRAPDDLVVLEEALPDPAAAPGYGRYGRRVTEYVLAVDDAEDSP